MVPWFLNHIPHIANYHWSPVIPKFYWAVKSQEQRLLHICRELGRLFAFSDFLVDSINDAYDVINKLSRTTIHGTKPIDVDQDFDTNIATISLDQQDILDNGLIGKEIDRKLEVPDIKKSVYIWVQHNEAGREVTVGLDEDAVLSDGKIHDELERKLEATDVATLRNLSTQTVVPIHYHTDTGASADWLNLVNPTDTHVRLGITLGATSYLANRSGAISVDMTAIMADSPIQEALDTKLEVGNLHAGDYTRLDKNGNDITIKAQSVSAESPMHADYDMEHNDTYVTLDQGQLVRGTGDNTEVHDEFAKKLEAENIQAGENITLDRSGNDIVINSTGGGSDVGAIYYETTVGEDIVLEPAGSGVVYKGVTEGGTFLALVAVLIEDYLSAVDVEYSWNQHLNSDGSFMAATIRFHNLSSIQITIPSETKMVVVGMRK